MEKNTRAPRSRTWTQKCRPCVADQSRSRSAGQAAKLQAPAKANDAGSGGSLATSLASGCGKAGNLMACAPELCVAVRVGAIIHARLAQPVAIARLARHDALQPLRRFVRADFAVHQAMEQRHHVLHPVQLR